MARFENHTPELAHAPGIVSRGLHWIGSAAGFCMILLARGYQAGLRPLLIGSCKFCPTCSEYFIEAVRKHGPLRGGRLGLQRLLRCHPFSAGGYDPVP